MPGRKDRNPSPHHTPCLFYRPVDSDVILMHVRMSHPLFSVEYIESINSRESDLSWSVLVEIAPISIGLLNLVTNDEILDMPKLVIVLIDADQSYVMLYLGYQDCILLRHSSV